MAALQVAPRPRGRDRELPVLREAVRSQVHGQPACLRPQRRHDSIQRAADHHERLHLRRSTCHTLLVVCLLFF